MTTPLLPREIGKPIVPPIKCQGIKTKLVSFIGRNIRWDGKGRWIEPFLGSGVVAFNIRPPKALLADINPHIIAFYDQINRGLIASGSVREHLEREGKILLEKGERHYCDVRERFNESAMPLDFLFLNRSSFNGIIRFNRKGKFNVPFCRKPDRFRKSYVTKIVNQVAAFREMLQYNEWEFTCIDWRASLNAVERDDFVYLDPPYIGRHADYYSQWSDTEANGLAQSVHELLGGYALSMWKENKYRKNPHIDDHWNGSTMRTQSHFYHVGSSEALRNDMEEALLIKPGYEAHPLTDDDIPTPEQLRLLEKPGNINQQPSRLRQ